MQRRVVHTDRVPPARTTFQPAGLVAGARVEIEAIAIA
jgi:enamine deaminase RidA (YjgF/YER057c/UK114 family)